jgi:hypothetical protein
MKHRIGGSSRLATTGFRGMYLTERSSNRERFRMDRLRIIIAILLPPLGVFLQVGIGKQFWINILQSNR